MRLRSTPWWRVGVTLGSVFVVGIAVALLFARWSSSPDDLAATTARAGISVAVITIAGAVATGSFKILDERRARDEERRRMFREVVDAYNEIKAVRRGMRAVGLPHGPAAGLTDETATEVRAMFARLVDAQLRVEALRREAEWTQLFRRQSELVEQLDAVEKYVNSSVLERWEARGRDVWKGAKPDVVRDVTSASFLGDGFKVHVATPLDRLERLMHQELYGGRRTGSVA